MIPLPGFLTARLAAGIAICAALVLSGWMARQKWDNARFVKLQLEQSQRVAGAEKKAREAIETVRSREAALIDQTRGIVDAAQKTIEDLERHRAAADRASGGLLDAARRAAARCAPGAAPATATRSPGPGVPGGLSDGERFLRVLGELDGAAGAYAADSGRARAARDACQRSYEAAMMAVNK
jgi:hypothetical protein